MPEGQDGVVRTPILIKGRLVAPPEIEKSKIETAFGEATPDAIALKLDGSWLIRERVIDRENMTPTGDFIYQVIPAFDPMKLIEFDVDKLGAHWRRENNGSVAEPGIRGTRAGAPAAPPPVPPRQRHPAVSRSLSVPRPTGRCSPPVTRAALQVCGRRSGGSAGTGR